MSKFGIEDQVRGTIDTTKEGTIKCVIERSINNTSSYSYLVFNENSNNYNIIQENNLRLIKAASPEDDNDSVKTVREVAESCGYKSDINVGDVVKFRDGMYGQYVVSSIIETTYGDELYQYELRSISSIGMKEDVLYTAGRRILEFQYNDKQYKDYFMESVENGLPSWRGDIYNWYAYHYNFENSSDMHKEYNNYTIPVEYMEHILKNHYIGMRINDIIKDNSQQIMDMLNIYDRFDLNYIRDELVRKIKKLNIEINPKNEKSIKNSKTNFTDKEEKLVDIIFDIDKKDLFPFRTINSQVMSALQIMDAIRDAYNNAEKTNTRTHQREIDKRTGESYSPIRGQRLYRGKSRKYNLTIEFWFDLDLKIVTTAYPVRMNDNTKKHK